MKKFAILGHDIGYTKSPKLHELIAMATDTEITYDVFDVPGDKLEETVKKLNTEYDGYNVTKPYKELILSKGLVDAVTPVAQILGACNTVKNAEGMSFAFNTDNYGLFVALRMTNVVHEQGWRCLIIGAGGAARAAISVLSTTCDLTVTNRSEERAKKMLVDMKLSEDKYVRPEDVTGGFDMIVNATPLGQNGEYCVPEGVDLKQTKMCFDMIYEPEETPFIKAAKEAGIPAFNGFNMLMAQAISAQEIWFDKKYTEDELQEILHVVTTMM